MLFFGQCNLICDKISLASPRSDAENGDVLLILVLRMRKVISPETLTSSSQVPKVKTRENTLFHVLSKPQPKSRNGGSMYFKTVRF